MSSEASIANQALQLIGAEDTIVSLDDADNGRARAMRVVWDDLRREVIRGTERFKPQWGFARSYAQLAARVPTVENPLPPGFTGAYPLPADCVRFLEIATPTCAIDDYVLASGDLLLRVDGPLGIWFLRDVPEVARWDDGFRAAFTSLLAFTVCERITGGSERKRDCWAAFEARIKAAAGAHAMEIAPIEPEESDWVKARFRAGGGW